LSFGKELNELGSGGIKIGDFWSLEGEEHELLTGEFVDKELLTGVLIYEDSNGSQCISFSLSLSNLSLSFHHDSPFQYSTNFLYSLL
jgi:hypothetical protein